MKLRTVFALPVFFGSSLICLPLSAEDATGKSDSERLHNLEKAVSQLQQRNAELENEVHALKSKTEPFAPIMSKSKVKTAAGNDNKAVFTEPAPPPVDVHPGGSEFKLT